MVASLVTAILLSPFAVMSRQSAIGAALQVVPWHVAFTGILGSFLLIGTTRWKYLVQISILRFFGRISYGLYLVHLLAFNAFGLLVPSHGLFGLTLRFSVAASAAILFAWLSREYFEERFLQRLIPSVPTVVTSQSS